MPDWNYKPLIEPVLHLFPEAVSQRMALRGVQFLGSNFVGRKSIDLMGHMLPPKSLSFQIGATTFGSRVFLSEEVDPDCIGQKAFAKFGFGALEMNFDHAVESLKKVSLPIPILPVIEFSDLESVKLAELIAGLKVLRLSESATQKIAHLNPDEQSEFLSKLRSIQKANQVEWIFTFSVLQDQEFITRFLPVLKRSLFCWIQMSTSEQTPKVFEMISKIQSFEFFKLIVSGGVTCPADYEKLRQHQVEVVTLDKALFTSGPGLPKRLNLAEEYARPPQLQTVEDQPATRMSWFWCLLLGLGMFLGSIMALVIAKTNVIFPYDESLSGITKQQLQGFNERVLQFMSHDRATLAGAMFSIGILYSSFSWFGIRKGLVWYREAVLYSALCGFINFFCFIGYGYFDVFHAFVTTCLFQIFVMAVYANFPKQRVITEPHRTNSLVWKLSLVAQLLFVIQGAGLILAGLVITYFGSTTVFVPQDLEYLCMSAETLKSLHANLVPLIAHDRCTFGGMLVCSGVLILLSALWGFEARQRWLWFTYAMSGFPAYLITLWVHSHIGYESFVHLLPVYIGLGLLVVSLSLSYPYFFED